MFETLCGTLVLGLLTRIAVIPLIVIMIASIISTKVPIFGGQDFWISHVPNLPRYRFWNMAHEARANFVMLIGLVYLLIEGAGAWSVDAMIGRRRRSPAK